MTEPLHYHPESRALQEQLDSVRLAGPRRRGSCPAFAHRSGLRIHLPATDGVHGYSQHRGVSRVFLKGRRSWLCANALPAYARAAELQRK